LSNEEKTNDYENFEKGMIYMKILKKVGVVEKRGEQETKSMPHAPVIKIANLVPFFLKKHGRYKRLLFLIGRFLTKYSPLKPLSQINRNLVGSIHGG
jgi:hypothetical protein